MDNCNFSSFINHLPFFRICLTFPRPTSIMIRNKAERKHGWTKAVNSVGGYSTEDIRPRIKINPHDTTNPLPPPRISFNVPMPGLQTEATLTVRSCAVSCCSSEKGSELTRISLLFLPVPNRLLPLFLLQPPLMPPSLPPLS